jgi:hypothetical protein
MATFPFATSRAFAAILLFLDLGDRMFGHPYCLLVVHSCSLHYWTKSRRQWADICSFEVHHISANGIFHMAKRRDVGSGSRAVVAYTRSFIVKYFVGFIQAALSFTARGKAAQIGLVQERLMDSLGYDRMQGVAINVEMWLLTTSSGGRRKAQRAS